METIMVEKKDGRFDIRPLINWLSHTGNGTYRVEVTKIRRQRSNDQNKWLWGCIYPLLRCGLNAQGWEFTTDEQVHEFFKQQMADEKILNTHTGEVVTISASTKEMDTLTFATYCDKLREYGREYLGIEIPDPVI